MTETLIKVKCSECEKTVVFRTLKEAFFDGWDIKSYNQNEVLSVCICPECSKTAWVRD